MRTASLRFDRDQMTVISGIRVAATSSASTLQLFARPGRTLALPCLKTPPPLVLSTQGQDGQEEWYLALLSLVNGAAQGPAEPTGACGDPDQVLLFIDTWDPHAQRVPGHYLLPLSHDARLPQAPGYGLAVCSVGDAILVQPTGGALVKLSLGLNRRFSTQPCSGEERILLQTP
jgi:hypothetical protein